MSEAEEGYELRRQNYVRTFPKEVDHVWQVLEDLARFCHAHESTYHTDPRMSDILTGRREVWLYIQKYTNLSADDILDLARRNPRSFDRRG